MGLLRSKIIAGIFVALTSGVAFSVTTTGASYAQTSGNVSVQGNERIATSTILTIVANEIEGGINTATINEAVQALNETGFFKMVSVSRQGNALRFEVEENPSVNRVAIEGNRRLDDEDLLALISTRSRQTFSRSQVQRDARIIADAYAAQGRISALVDAKIIERSQNRVDVVFEIVEGTVSEVEKINFIGNRNFSNRRLRAIIDSKQAGIFRALIRNDTYIEDRLEFDKQQLRDFYIRNGFIDFQVLSANAEFVREQDGFLVNFNLREGQQYRFGEATIISLESDIDAVEFEQFLKGIPTGRVYNPARVDEVTERIDDYSARSNLPFLQAIPRVTRNDDDRTLDIEFELVRGPRTFVERIDIEGNATTYDRVIRRQFDIVEGDPFNRRRIQQATDRIRALGYFSSVDVQAREGSSPSQAIVDVDVEEQPTGELTFGLGYSNDTGASGTVSLTERNFLGRGQTLRFAISNSSEDRAFSFGFDEPAFLDRDLLVGIDLGLSTTNSSFLPIDTETLSFRPRVEFPISENGRLGVFYSLSRDDIQISEVSDGMGGTMPDDASAITLAEAAQGTTITSQLGATFTVDRRNSPIAPTSGYRFNLTQAIAGLGGDHEYSKTTADFKTFRSFFEDRVILSAEVEGGAIVNFGNEARINERFLLGGNSMRGFQYAGLGPRDEVTGDAVGGNLMAVARFEASFPIGLPEEYGIFGGVFLDVGTTWGLDTLYGASVYGEDDSPTFRSAIGFSLFIDTAIGPLRFNFARPIDKQDYDITESFRFTIDTRF